VFEFQRGDAQLARCKLVEDLLGLVRTVVAAHAGVIATHDKMRTPVVLAHDGVKNRFARSAVPHGGGIDDQCNPVLRVVVLEECFIGLNYDLVLVISFFLLSEDGVDEEAVDEGECRLLDVLVAYVGGVSRLECDYRPPSKLLEENPGLNRPQGVLGNFRVLKSPYIRIGTYITYNAVSSTPRHERYANSRR